MVRDAPNAGANRKGRGADPSGRAVHQHRLSGLQPAADPQREVHGQVVVQQPGTRLESHAVRQLEHQIRIHHRNLGHTAAEHGQTGDAVPGTHMRTLRHGPHHTGNFGTWDERQLLLVLIKPASLQGVGKRHTRGVHIDEDLAVTAWLRNLDDMRCLRAVEPGYLYRAHGGLPLIPGHHLTSPNARRSRRGIA